MLLMSTETGKVIEVDQDICKKLYNTSGWKRENFSYSEYMLSFMQIEFINGNLTEKSK